MTGLKKTGRGLVLASGIIETIVAFAAYWVFYAFYKSGSFSLVTPMVLLLAGMLGGILAIIGGATIKSTRLGGPILSLVGAALELFASLYLIIQVGLQNLPEDAAMISLPFFILPNALGIAGAVMAIIPPKDQAEVVPTPAKAEAKEESKEEK